ncbi:DUF3891 family protein [Lichenicoccus sp.]|uniref:DUF3891 family protein n=1 Tax=Lichenicoccus sp. TaxID=2781899 RepID=UPI003D13CBE6
MLFRQAPSPALAISQPAHAWISGQLLRAWAGDVDEALQLAAEQHDIGWLDWEADPGFDPRTGRPYLFRDVGAAIHAPMWRRGVERALAAWGTRVALLISRHGGVIYRRFTDRHRLSQADADAATRYLETQAPVEAAWTQALGLEPAALQRDTLLLACVDSLSLGLCGELAVPLDVAAPDPDGGIRQLRLQAQSADGSRFTLSPWPFRAAEIVVVAEARPLPAAGRFEDADAMRSWLAVPGRVPLRIRLTRPET